MNNNDDATKVGNFFISNYPQYSFWKPDNVPDALNAIETEVDDESVLGLYAHIPFCRKRCHFCYFRVYTDKNAQEINGYLEGVLKELEAYAQSPFISHRLPKFVYFGGGTPSYLSRDQFTTLTDKMKELLSWEEAEEVTIECEPGTLTEQKIRNFKEIGVTRVSLGIENFDDSILEKNNRAHRSKEIIKAYNTIKDVGFEQVNVDLISGMMGETDDNWKSVIQQTIELSPDSVTIYQMEIPFNTTIYQNMKTQGAESAPVADWETKRRWVNEAFNEFEKAGYSILDAYTVVKNPDSTKFVYREKLWTGADMIGLGVSSFGHINDTHIQNEKDVEPYLKRLANNELPIYRALTINEEEKLIRAFILKMKMGRVDVKYFTKMYDVNILDKFKDGIEKMLEHHYLTVNDDEIKLTREGLLKVDNLIHQFFLPEHQNARYT